MQNHLRSGQLRQPIPRQLQSNPPSVFRWRSHVRDVCNFSFALLARSDVSRPLDIGGFAEEILALTGALTLAQRKQMSFLWCRWPNSAFGTDTVSLADIYGARSTIRFWACRGSRLVRNSGLQSPDQPMGEFLIGMEPIKTWKGEPVILTVANGGAGLVLIGLSTGSADRKVPWLPASFVRSNEVASAKAVRGVDEAAARGHR